jgi:hypothetical protein
MTRNTTNINYLLSLSRFLLKNKPRVCSAAMTVCFNHRNFKRKCASVIRNSRPSRVINRRLGNKYTMHGRTVVFHNYCNKRVPTVFQNLKFLSWTIGVLGFDSRRRLRIFSFTTAFRTTLGPTQPPIQWARGALSLEVERPGREADHSPTSSVEVKECVELYLHSPNMPSWRGA